MKLKQYNEEDLENHSQSNYSFEYREGMSGLSVDFNFSTETLGDVLEQFKNFLIASGYSYVDAVSAFSDNMEFTTQEEEEEEEEEDDADEDEADEE
jgi:transcription elongation factor Elf1